MKVGIIGAGAWGTALAHVCVRNNNDAQHIQKLILNI